MALIQHVSPLEGIDREPERDQLDKLATIRRQLSYDVLQPSATLTPAVDKRSGTAAYKNSTFKRATQVAVTVFSCWLASGIVFGFAALKPILIAEGVYHDSDNCTDEELQRGVELCTQQDLRLNLYFIIASITANVSALPVGTILDKTGSRICGVIGCVVLAAGSLVMAFSFLWPWFHGYMAGNFLLAMASTFIFIPSYQIANAFPKRAGLVVALVTGAFDASAAIFLLYRVAYEISSRVFTPYRFFFGYLTVPAFILVVQLVLMPKKDYHTTMQLEKKLERAEDATRDFHESDNDIGSGTELFLVHSQRARRRERKRRQVDSVLGDRAERQESAKLEKERNIASRVWGALHGVPAYRQMMTPWFALITLMTVLQMLRMNYFIATIRAQYEYMLGSAVQAEAINNFFDLALPLGGMVSTPFIGLLLGRLSVPTVLTLIVIFTTLTGAVNSISSVWAGYVTVILFVLLRPFYYSAMSDYTTKVFGFATFGRVYGTIICLSGLVNLSQYSLDVLTHRTFEGNPAPVNVSLTIAGLVVGIALAGYVFAAGRRMATEAEVLNRVNHEERERLIPEEEEGEGEEERGDNDVV